MSDDEVAAGRGSRPRPGPRRYRGRLLRSTFLPERDNARNFPFVPHLVDLLLEVREIFLGKVGEPALLEQVLAHGLARAPFGDRLGLSVVTHHTVLHLVEREDARLHRELAELVAEHGVIVPALRARIERVDEGRPA